MVNLNWVVIVAHNALSGSVLAALPNPTEAKILGMVGYAGRTKRQTVFDALQWRCKINESGFTSVDAFPGDNGEILVSGIQNDLEFEVIVEDNRALTVNLSRGDTVLRSVSYGNLAAADSVLREAAVRIWTSSGGLRVTNSTGVRCDLQPSLLENHQAMVACR